MNWCYREPTLAEMLSDTIVKSLMKADGVDPGELEGSIFAVVVASGVPVSLPAL